MRDLSCCCETGSRGRAAPSMCGRARVEQEGQGWGRGLGAGRESSIWVEGEGARVRAYSVRFLVRKD